MSHRRHTQVWSKPCCHACVKAGKSNKEAAHQYETAGKITCPMVRARGCTYCKESAHVNQECPKLLAKKEREQSELNLAKFRSSFRTSEDKAAASRRWVEAKERESLALKTKNTFAALDEDSSDEECEFPALPKKESSQKRPREPSPMSDCSDGGTKSWSSIIGPAQTIASSASQKTEFKTPVRKMPVAIPCAPRKMSAKEMDWSIESDDEDEDAYLPYDVEV